jgi:hypothetical protein
VSRFDGLGERFHKWHTIRARVKKTCIVKESSRNCIMAYDWSVPVKSLLHKFQMAGFNISAVHDGQEMIRIDQKLSQTKIKHSATDIIVSVDESVVHIHKDGMNARLFIVLGNEPEELVADYNYNLQLEELLEETIDKYVEKWEGKKCPMIAD